MGHFQLQAIFFSLFSVFVASTSAADIQPFFGHYQVVARNCKADDQWCSMISQISFLPSNKMPNLIEITELGSNNNQIVNYLFTVNFEQVSPAGDRVRDAFASPRPNKLIWTSARSKVSPASHLEERYYFEQFTFVAVGEFVFFSFSNAYLRHEGPDRLRVLKLKKI